MGAESKYVSPVPAQKPGTVVDKIWQEVKNLAESITQGSSKRLDDVAVNQPDDLSGKNIMCQPNDSYCINCASKFQILNAQISANNKFLSVKQIAGKTRVQLSAIRKIESALEAAQNKIVQGMSRASTTEEFATKRKQLADFQESGPVKQALHDHEENYKILKDWAETCDQEYINLNLADVCDGGQYKGSMFDDNSSMAEDLSIASRTKQACNNIYSLIGKGTEEFKKGIEENQKRLTTELGEIEKMRSAVPVCGPDQQSSSEKPCKPADPSAGTAPSDPGASAPAATAAECQSKGGSWSESNNPKCTMPSEATAPPAPPASTQPEPPAGPVAPATDPSPGPTPSPGPSPGPSPSPSNGDTVSSGGSWMWALGAGVLGAGIGYGVGKHKKKKDSDNSTGTGSSTSSIASTGTQTGTTTGTATGTKTGTSTGATTSSGTSTVTGTSTSTVTGTSTATDTSSASGTSTSTNVNGTSTSTSTDGHHHGHDRDRGKHRWRNRIEYQCIHFDGDGCTNNNHDGEHGQCHWRRIGKKDLDPKKVEKIIEHRSGTGTSTSTYYRM